jgi:hypothetical protein
MFALDNHQHDELVPSTVREEESEQGEEDQEDPSRFLLVKHVNYSLRDLTLVCAMPTRSIAYKKQTLINRLCAATWHSRSPYRRSAP